MNIDPNKYSLKEIAKNLGVSISLLRLWGKEFKLFDTTDANIKLGQKEIIELSNITELVKIHGFSLVQIQAFTDRNRLTQEAQEEAKEDVLNKLKDLKKRLSKFKENLET